MPSYKLYYFNAPARGELPRIIMSAAGQPFEDIRFESKDWPSYKEKMPFCQIPVLDVDGLMIAQEYAISKYLAKEFGFCSESNIDQAVEDMYVFASEDIYVKAEAIFFTKEDKKAEVKKKFIEETIPFYLSRFEKKLSNSEKGYFVGERISWADMALFCCLQMVEFVLREECTSLLTPYPAVRKDVELVRSISGVSAYLKNRPALGSS